MTTSVEGPRTSWIPDDSTFGARLALVRNRMGWGNVKEAADACGVPVESWRRWERDGRKPRDVTNEAEKISDRTGCDYDWLIRGRRLNERLAPARHPNGAPGRRNRRTSRRPGQVDHRPGSPPPPNQRRPVAARMVTSA